MMKMLITIGPASVDDMNLTKFAKKTKLFRLNGSHGTLEWHRAAISSIRRACPDAFILMDIPGIKPRTSNTTPIFIEKTQEVVFGEPALGEERLVVELTKTVPKHDEYLTKFSVNDGQFEFDYVTSDTGYIVGRSRSNFTLLEKKGINLPGSIYDETKQFEIYNQFLKNLVDMDIDGLGLSFVQTGELVSKIKIIAPGLVLVAKVENSEGLRNCVEIVRQSDAIMIDRGDLAAEIGFDNLFPAINYISDQTKAHGKPLIMATENLETMLERNVPSKSEVMSIAHSASIGVDCIMLSEETATSKTGQATVAWLENFLTSCPRVNQPKSSSTVLKKFPSIWRSLLSLEAMPIIIATKSGYALFEYFSVAPDGTLILVTQNKKLSKICDLYANKIELIQKDLGHFPAETLWGLIKDNRDWLFEKSEQIAAVYVTKYVNTARANSITIFDRSDFGLEPLLAE